VVRLPGAKNAPMTIVRNNKSQVYLQVKVKEEFHQSLRSAVIECRGLREIQWTAGS
jgi:hypothetical protein